VRWSRARSVGAAVAALLILAVSVYIAAWITPGVELEATGAAFAVAVVVAALGAVLPPLIAMLPLPFTLPLGFLLVLLADAGILLAADALLSDVTVSSFWAALLASILIAGCSLVVSMLVGVDEQAMSLRVLRRVARRQGVIARTDAPGIVFLEVDGLALPVLRRAMQSGHAPHLARWISEDGYRLEEWETDLSSQTGASQAGILLGSNDGIPAFRWVEKADRRVVACSSPADCADIERRHSDGRGLLAGGGASRGNLLSGEADEVILTVSRMVEERRANPGYRAFLATGSNVTRSLALFAWEVVLEWLAAARQRRRDITPRGHRGGIYPFLRATLCVLIRDLTVFGVMTDIMRGRPAVYATFASYDEVAHHSGLERADTLEALRKLDERFGRIRRMVAQAPRPYAVVVLSDHGQTQGATFLQRNGYGLDDLVRRSLATDDVASSADGDEQRAMVDHALREASGRTAAAPADGVEVAQHDVVVLGSGNLGLIYLMDEPRRLTQEEIDARHPQLLEALRRHEDIGWLLVRSADRGAVVLGREGSVGLADGSVEGVDPLAVFGPTARQHIARTDGFDAVPDILVGSFYDPAAEEGCAFEELISFHGGLGGPQTRPFVMHPPELPPPAEPLVGAAAVHRLLSGWRDLLQGPAPPGTPASADGAPRRVTASPS
jgi:uncharacterized membrane protein YvlD (DUF360 family)